MPPPPRDDIASPVGRVLATANVPAVILHCVVALPPGKPCDENPEGQPQLWNKVARKISRHRGQVLLRLGAECLAVLPSARDAWGAATAIHRSLGQPRSAHPTGARVGLHAIASRLGSAEALPGSPEALLVAQLAHLADAGQTVCSTSVRDQLCEGLDAQVHDLGECHIKFRSEPVRAYQLTDACDPSPWMDEKSDSERPALAVIPLRARTHDPDFFVVGELLADRVITQLGRSDHVRVISRLSGTAFRDRAEDPAMIRDHLQARYVLTGQYKVVGKHLQGLLGVQVELTDNLTGEVVWSQSLRGSVGELLAQESELVHTVATGVHHAILDAQVTALQQQPIRCLDNYALMLGGIALMHRSAPDQFGTGRLALEELLRRDPGLDAARAWLAKWYVLRVTRGLTTNPQADADAALAQARQSQRAPDAAGLGLAMEGFVHLHLLRDFERAQRLIDRACSRHPSEPLAWLFGGVAHSFLDQPDAALAASRRALSLSPLDPLLYYFESLAASSAIVARRYEEAITLCRRSLRRNVTHLHTHRALVTACWAAGKPVQARQAAQQLLRLSPGYTVAAYERASASRQTRFGRLMAQALAGAGIPSG